MPESARGAFNERQEQRLASRRLLRELQQAADAISPEITDLAHMKPAWAHQLTQSPLQRASGPLPADAGWWNQALNVDPDAVEPGVMAFLKAIRDDASAFQYGTMPKGAHSIEDFADAFGERAGKRIDVDYEPGDGAEAKIEVKETHGRGEVMRDHHGDYKQEPKLHEPGDSPMYDEYGDVKKVKVDIDEEGNPIKKKRVAEGGEPVREGGRYGGDEKYRYIKSEGGEPMRDERGNVKSEWKDNPDYTGDDTMYLRAGQGDEIKVEGWGGDEPTVYAMDAGKNGALLYQTLLAHASKAGQTIGASGLTQDNALRILSNTLADFTPRTGRTRAT